MTETTKKIIDIEKYDANMRTAGIGSAQPRWYSPMESPFQLAGFPWFAQDRKYRRMPVQPTHPLPEAVNGLADCTAGGQIRFITDSARLFIRVRLMGPANMVHMPATGQCGFDCYIGAPGQQRYCSTTGYPLQETEYEIKFFELPSREMRHITLNFPLYQGVEEVAVGVDDGAQVLPPAPYDDDRPVIAYGTSITQGGCACRPGSVYTNILSRRINREFINLGFSGSGKGEPEVARTIAEIPNPGCFILDYEANCVSTDTLQQTFPNFIAILREAHPTTPILVVSQIKFAGELFMPVALHTRLERLAFQRDVVEKLRRAGDRRISFLDGSGLLGENFDECTVDSVHPTDLGFMRMADGLTPVVREILRENG
ncbi:MAG: SGNH/GDSL hydrolase family protein [Armatimonadota bacterium]